MMRATASEWWRAARGFGHRLAGFQAVLGACRGVMIAGLLSLAVLQFSASPALAVKPDEVMTDPAKEKRAREISAGLRCVVCQNQSIDDSDAPLARDLRLLVRERLKAGDSNSQVLDFVVARYGDFVLLKPPFNMQTLFLWLAPLFVLLGGIWLARTTILRARDGADDGRAVAAAASLSADEEAKLKRLMDADAGGGGQK